MELNDADKNALDGYREELRNYKQVRNTRLRTAAFLFAIMGGEAAWLMPRALRDPDIGWVFWPVVLVLTMWICALGMWEVYLAIRDWRGNLEKKLLCALADRLSAQVSVDAEGRTSESTSPDTKQFENAQSPGQGFSRTP